MSRYTGGGGYMPLTPTSPATIFGGNLIAWYDANVGVTLSGSNVTAWADQSGNSHNITSGATNPTFSSTGFNSKPAVQFVNSTTSVCQSSAFNINSNVVSVFAVLNISADFTSGRVLSYYDPASSDFSQAAGIIFLYSSAVGHLGAFTNGAAAGDYIVASGANIRFAGTFDGPGTTYTMYVNNSSIGGASITNNTLGTAATVFNVGTTITNTCDTFAIGEIALVNVVASTSQLLAMDTYFKSKWGL